MSTKLSLLIGLLLMLCHLDVAAQFKVTGNVVDKTNEPIIGATITVKGSKVNAVTDLDGNFTINAPSSKSTLVVSYIGMKNQEVNIAGKTNLNIILADDEQTINEVVVVGFATQKKLNMTGAVKTISGEVLDARPVSNAVQGLQGAIAGLNITNDAGGALGQSMNINIRGVGSIGDGSNASPLVLIDGMEGDLSTINPDDIENISVLKDAASASIYGSRAPFGVILVTTKGGSEGKLTLNYKGNLRISQPNNVPSVPDSYTYALMVNDAFINSGGNAQFGYSQLQKMLAYQRGELEYGIGPVENQNDWMYGQRSWGNSNWYDIYMKDHTSSMEHNVSLSGGSKKVKYYLSGNILSQTGLFNFADEQYQRMSFNGKVNIELNKHINLTWNTRFVTTENEKPTALDGLFFHNLGRRAPNQPLMMPNGEYNKESLVPSLLYGGRNKQMTQQLYNQLTLAFKPLKDWNINLDINSRIEDPRTERSFNTVTYTLPDGTTAYTTVFEGIATKFEMNPNGTFRIQPGAGQTAYEKTTGHNNYFNTNLYTDYTFKTGGHEFKALVGTQWEYYRTENNMLASPDILLSDRPFINSAAENKLINEKKGDWASIGFFGRLNWSYKSRYMAEFNIRRDGASRFPSDKRWAVFPSVSLGWNIAEEPFWAPLQKAGIEFLKFRASYGTLGNQNTTSFYPYYQSMNAGLASVVLNGQQVGSLPVYAPFTTNLTWERIENNNFGVDWSFFNSHFSGEFNIYQRTTKNMLGPSIPLAAVFGGNAPKTNTAEMRTRGWELEMTYRDRIGKDFNFSITGTLSDYKSVITKYASTTNSLDGWYSGKEYGEIWGYHVLGIAKSDLEMNEYLAQHPQNAIGQKWGAGDLMYANVDNDPAINSGSKTTSDHGDLMKIGNSTPRYAYGITLTGNYKIFDIRVFFQGIGKRDFAFATNSTPFYGFGGSPWQRTLYMEHLDYFRLAGSSLGANLDPYYGRLRTDANNIQVSDRFLQDASYLRLKNIQIGVSLPKNRTWLKWIQRGRLYLSGENLLTFTKLRIFDPEALNNDGGYGSGKTYPMYRVWSLGLELSF